MDNKKRTLEPATILQQRIVMFQPRLTAQDEMTFQQMLYASRSRPDDL